MRSILFLLYCSTLCLLGTSGSWVHPPGLPGNAMPPIPSVQNSQVYVVGRSKADLVDFLKPLVAEPDVTYNEFFEAFLERFQGYPYGAGTTKDLAGLKSGQTMVNFESMDCVTFIENYWATYQAYKQLRHYRHKRQPLTDKDYFNAFVHGLNEVRYYQGHNCSWDDRIYYFTAALEALEEKGWLMDIGTRAGIPMSKKIHYVSSNKAKFAGIQDWKRIKHIEQQLTRANLHYFPLDDIDHYQSIAKTGDIIALATNVPGLDVSHCGFIHQEGDCTYFSHASSTRKKIVFKEELLQYLSTRNTITGILVYRPNTKR
jgi:hypothetical protein